MAISRKTQKDVGNYEAKFLGPFTARQSAMIGLGAVPSVLSYMVLYGISGDKIIGGVIAFIMMIPFLFLAFGKSICFGMNPEDFLLEYYFYHVKAPVKRKYKTETLDDKLEAQRIKELKKEAAKQAANKKKSKKKNDDEEEIVIEEIGKFKKYPHKVDPEIKEFN